MDRDYNLIVIELKRKSMEREVIAQILDYGSWIDTVDNDDVFSIYEAYRKKYFPSQGANHKGSVEGP
jgi:hypothetical protein